MMMNDPGIKVKCKNCQKSVPVKELVLDPIFKMMVCQSCIKERLTREKVHEELAHQKAAAEVKKAQEPPKPAGWDQEDELLNKAYQEKEKNTVKVEPVDAEKVKYSCPKCKYTFTYNVIKKTPSTCPYCGIAIYRFKM